MKNIFTILTGLILLTASLFICFRSNAQLQPGFDKEEYIEMIKVSAHQLDTPWKRSFPMPQHFKLNYRSLPMGLDNQWDLWLSENKTAVISIRGTNGTPISWLENFFAAMVPAKGDLQLKKGKIFHYELASNPKAAVHVGWLVGMIALSESILHKMDSCYKSGIKDFIIMGHSQGAAISFLLRSYLDYAQSTGQVPSDIRIKTYCSGAPKPGNMFYAYDYEYLNRGGWSFTVVNTEDWVPQTPTSVQTVWDYNTVNPFSNAKTTIRKQPFGKRVALSFAYNNLRNPANKLERRYRKYLGEKVYKMLKKDMPDLVVPPFYKSNNYVRAGVPIILKPDSVYFQKFRDTTGNLFIHHLMNPYLYLAEHL